MTRLCFFMHIILIGNYIPDRQESMERFALMLQSGFENAGILSEVWRPTVFFGKWSRNAHSGLGKWFGYIDKWILFPMLLSWRLRNNLLHSSEVRFHICDHSNAPYLNYLPRNSTGITCHDVLAIRGALGYTDAYCPATKTGKILQKWILNNLVRAKRLAAVSQNTLTQLNELAPNIQSSVKDWRLIHVGFNNAFKAIEKHEAEKLVEAVGISKRDPFLLCVGSSLARKNRKLLLDMISCLNDQWQGNVCFAGQAADEYLLTYADSLGIKDRIISVVKPDHATLIALYCTCKALVFPSFSEGFGWPVIEAQACGAPVIASSIAPMPEVSGGAALYADPYQPEAFADAFLQLQNISVREELIQRGFINCQRFGASRMITAYLDLYGLKPGKHIKA